MEAFWFWMRPEYHTKSGVWSDSSEKEEQQPKQQKQNIAQLINSLLNLLLFELIKRQFLFIPEFLLQV